MVRWRRLLTKRWGPLPWWAVIICVFALLSPVIFYQSPQPASACRERYVRDKSAVINGKRLQLQIADSDAERQQGLSGRRCIGEGQGLLFVFDTPDFYKIWMKDMSFPIDILWLDENKRVVSIKHRYPPSSYPDSITSSAPARYVIELDAGQAEKYGLREGSVVSW